MDEWLSSHTLGLPLASTHGDGEPEGHGVRVHRTPSGRLILSSREGRELEVSPDTVLFSHGADAGVKGEEEDDDDDIFCESRGLGKRGWSLDSSQTSLSEELREFYKIRSKTTNPPQSKENGNEEKEIGEAQAGTETDRSPRDPPSSSSSSYSESYRYYLSRAAGIHHVMNPSIGKNNANITSSDDDLELEEEGGRDVKTEVEEVHPPWPTSIRIPPAVDLEMLGDAGIIHPALLHRHHNHISSHGHSCTMGLERDAFSAAFTSSGRYFNNENNNNNNTSHNRPLTLFEAYNDGGAEFGSGVGAWVGPWWGHKAVAVATSNKRNDTYSSSSSSLSSSSSSFLPTSQRMWTDEKRVSNATLEHKDDECRGFSAADLTVPTAENTDTYCTKGLLSPEQLLATHLRVGEEVQKVRALLNAMEGCKLPPSPASSTLAHHRLHDDNKDNNNETVNYSAQLLPTNLDMALAKEKVAFFENNLQTLGKRLMEMKQHTAQEGERGGKCIKGEEESANNTHISLGLVPPLVRPNLHTNGTKADAAARRAAAPRPPPRFLLVHEDLLRLTRAFAAALMVFITFLLLLSFWASEVDDGDGYGIDTARYSTTGKRHSRDQRVGGEGLVWTWRLALACLETMERAEHALFGTRSFSAAKFRKAVETLTSATVTQRREGGEESQYRFGFESDRLGLGERGDEGRHYYVDEALAYPDHNPPSYQTNEGRRAEESEEDRRERVMLEMRRLHYMASNGFEPVHQHQQEELHNHFTSPSALRSSMSEPATTEKHHRHRHDPSRTHIPYPRPQKGREIKDGDGGEGEKINSLQRNAKRAKFVETLPSPQSVVSQVVAGVSHMTLSGSSTSSAVGGVSSGFGGSNRGVQGHGDHLRYTKSANTYTSVGRDAIVRDGAYWLWRQAQHTAHVGRFYSQIGERQRGLGCDGDDEAKSVRRHHPSLSVIVPEGGISCCDTATMSNATLEKKCVRACTTPSGNDDKAPPDEGRLFEDGDGIWNHDEDTKSTPSSFVLRRSSACYFSGVALPKNAGDGQLDGAILRAPLLPHTVYHQSIGGEGPLFSFVSFDDSADPFSFAAYQAELHSSK